METALFCKYYVPSKYRIKYKSYIFRCETFTSDDKACKSNFRASCREVLLREEILAENFQFEIQQNFSLITDAEKLAKHKAIGTFKAQTIIDAHYRACLHAGIKISGAGSGVHRKHYIFDIGPQDGIRVCDDLTVARYLLERIASDFGALAVYDGIAIDNQ